MKSRSNVFLLCVFCAVLLILVLMAVDLGLAKLEPNTPVEVSLKNGWSIQGRLLRASTDSVTLDVSPGAGAFIGTLTLASDSIISIKAIQAVPALKVPSSPSPQERAKPEAKQEKPTPTPTVTPKPARNPLLAEFPPEDGWGKKKLDWLRWRQVVIGVFPSDKEQKFIKSFDEWEKAWDEEQKKAGKDETQAK